MTNLDVPEVFVAGGQPTYTYVERSGHDLEREIEDYLRVGRKILMVTGPTKSGKTVLVREKVSDKKRCLVAGGQITCERDFWVSVSSEIGHPITRTKSDGTTKKVGGKGDVSLDGFVVEGGAQASVGLQGEKTKQSTYRADSKAEILDALQSTSQVLVIDDFHYIERSIQKNIVRSLKEPLYDGLRVILIAVPHRALDVVKSEDEMTGRVKSLTIPAWEKKELRVIPEDGFSKLNLHASDEIIEDFLECSYQSPHLVQDFCLHLCFQNEIYQADDETRSLSTPDDLLGFFKDIAEDTGKQAFERLSTGPQQRSDRKSRSFIDDMEGDIYDAVLKAIAKTGPVREIEYEELRAALGEVIADEDDVPQMHEVTRVLRHMTDIAKKEIPGEPVLEWVTNDKLYIVDPFFAFYLHWAERMSLEN